MKWFFKSFLDEYSYNTPYLQHCTDKKTVWKSFLLRKFSSAAPNNAYEILHDTEKRKVHDVSLRIGEAGDNDEEGNDDEDNDDDKDSDADDDRNGDGDNATGLTSSTFAIVLSCNHWSAQLFVAINLSIKSVKMHLSKDMGTVWLPC